MKATIFLNTLFIKDKREREATLENNYVVNYKAIKNYVESKNPQIDDCMSWEEIKEMYESVL